VNLAMAQLIAYAFVCDVTRIATFQFKRFVSNTTFNDGGISGVHHSNSHGGPTNPSYMAGVAYQMTRLFDVLATLRDTEEFDGSNLLDSSIVYATTDCSTPNTHTISRQPIIVAGTGRGYLVHPGIHHQAVAWNGNNGNPNSTGNMTDVLLTCLRAFDPEAPSVGGGAPFSDTPLTEIIADA
jgi:hypothetical protein